MKLPYSSQLNVMLLMTLLFRPARHILGFTLARIFMQQILCALQKKLHA